MSAEQAWDVERMTKWIEDQRFRLVTIIDRRLSDQLRRRLEAEDILQDVLTRAIQSIANQPFVGDDPFPWLIQIVEHQIIDAHRFHFGAQKRDAAKEMGINAVAKDPEDQNHDFFDLLVASFTTPSQAFSRNIRLERLHNAVKALPEESRQAIQLRYIEGKSGQEIAKVLGKSHGAVRVLLTRSLQKLQEAVE